MRQALQYAVDRRAYVQGRGGDRLGRPLYQAVLSGSDGSVPGAYPYAVPGDHGDPAKAHQLLTEAGYPSGLTLTLIYPVGVYGTSPQTFQASFERAGIHLRLLPANNADFYAKYLQNPESGRKGSWDLALTGWLPDWGGTNARSIISPLFDGRGYGSNSMNFGAYNGARTNVMIDSALASATVEKARHYWEAAAAQVMADAAIVPLRESKILVYHSARVRHCVFGMFGQNCSFTELWLKGGAKEARR